MKERDLRQIGEMQAVPRIHLLLFTYCIIACAVAVVGWILTRPQTLNDFTIYWKSTQHFVSGLDPYNLPHQSTYISGSSATGSIRKMWNPPYVFAVTWPFGFLSQDTAGDFFLLLSWLGLSLATLSLCIIYWSNTGGSSAFKIFASFTVASGFIFQSIIWGSLTWICLVGIVAFIALLEQKKYALAGVALFLTLLKPQVCTVTYGYLLVLLLREKNAKPFVAFMITVAASLVLITLINPNAWGFYLNAAGMDLPYSLTTATFPSLLYELTGRNSKLALILPWIIFGVIYLTTLLLQKRSLDPKRDLAFWLPASVLFSPYAWGSDYVVCLPAIFYGFQVSSRRFSSDMRTSALLSLFCVAFGAFLQLYYGAIFSRLYLNTIYADDTNFIRSGFMMLVAMLTCTRKFDALEINPKAT